MLSERERDTLREIQRQFLIQDQGLVRSFHAAPGRSANYHWRQVYTTAVLVAVALIVLMLIGPNALTYKDITARRTPPAPRRSSTAPPAPGELAARDGVLVSQTLTPPGSAEFGTPQALWLLTTPATRSDKEMAASPSQRWRTPTAAA
jgi:hypothetical protein